MWPFFGAGVGLGGGLSRLDEKENDNGGGVNERSGVLCRPDSPFGARPETKSVPFHMTSWPPGGLGGHVAPVNAPSPSSWPRFPGEASNGDRR